MDYIQSQCSLVLQLSNVFFFAADSVWQGVAKLDKPTSICQFVYTIH